MSERSRRYTKCANLVDTTRSYGLDDALATLKKGALTTFDQSVELAINIKLKKSETVRSTVVYPHAFGVEKRVVVFAKGEKMKEAEDAGAHFVGNADLIEKIKGGWLEFDATVATPDCMKDVAALGPLLGRRGLMPNPKAGTVTMDIGAAVAELRAGRKEFRADKGGTVHILVGKVSMDNNKLIDNCRVSIDAIRKALPESAHDSVIQSAYISLSMSPSVLLDIHQLHGEEDA